MGEAPCHRKVLHSRAISFLPHLSSSRHDLCLGCREANVPVVKPRPMYLNFMFYSVKCTFEAQVLLARPNGRQTTLQAFSHCSGTQVAPNGIQSHQSGAIAALSLFYLVCSVNFRCDKGGVASGCALEWRRRACSEGWEPPGRGNFTATRTARAYSSSGKTLGRCKYL